MTAGGSVSYGCTLHAVHRQTRGVDLSLDLISRVLADLKQDTSQLIDDLISSYQRTEDENE
eukprot:COSAG01_NODE_768_length_13739_cov_6.271334_13_plen_61_part_00